MCDFGMSEMIMAGVAIASTIASTTLGVVENINKTNAANAEREYQNAVNRQNAKIAQDNAAFERQKGLEEARFQRIKTLQTIGDNKASLASSGFDVGFGTSLDLIEDTSMMGELEALMIESNAEKRAQSYDLSASNSMNKLGANVSSASNGITLAKNLSSSLGSLSSKLNF